MEGKDGWKRRKIVGTEGRGGRGGGRRKRERKKRREEGALRMIDGEDLKMKEPDCEGRTIS